MDHGHRLAMYIEHSWSRQKQTTQAHNGTGLKQRLGCLFYFVLVHILLYIIIFWKGMHITVLTNYDDLNSFWDVQPTSLDGHSNCQVVGLEGQQNSIPYFALWYHIIAKHLCLKGNQGHMGPAGVRCHPTHKVWLTRLFSTLLLQMLPKLPTKSRMAILSIVIPNTHQHPSPYLKIPKRQQVVHTASIDEDTCVGSCCAFMAAVGWV